MSEKAMCKTKYSKHADNMVANYVLSSNIPGRSQSILNIISSSHWFLFIWIPHRNCHYIARQWYDHHNYQVVRSWCRENRQLYCSRNKCYENEQDFLRHLYQFLKMLQQGFDSTYFIISALFFLHYVILKKESY